MNRALALAAAVAIGVAAPARADAPEWSVLPESRLGFMVEQEGVPIEGTFGAFEARISFEPGAVPEGSVRVTIDMGSVSTESRDRDDVIRSAPLYDVGQWPRARFEADRFETDGSGGYVAVGRLAIRDVALPVRLPFILTVVPDAARPGIERVHAEGALEIRRLDYGVGQGDWRDTSVVADKVRIFIDIIAERELPRIQ